MIFKKIIGLAYYYKDLFNSPYLQIKIEDFTYDDSANIIFVFYRQGRQKLIDKMNVINFEKEYFEKLSNFDRYRLIKLVTLQNTLQCLFVKGNCDRNAFVNLIKDCVRNDKPF